MTAPARIHDLHLPRAAVTFTGKLGGKSVPGCLRCSGATERLPGFCGGPLKRRCPTCGWVGEVVWTDDTSWQVED